MLYCAQHGYGEDFSEAKDFMGDYRENWGKLKALNFIGSIKGRTIWSFECDCGNFVERSVADAIKSKNPSCGCLSKKTFKDLTGKEFGMLTVKSYIGTNELNHRLWLCVCECGNEKPISSGYLNSDYMHSCGCNRGRDEIHWMSFTPLHSSWAAMKARCLNPNHEAYKNYGGRGITIYEPWLEFIPFKDHCYLLYPNLDELLAKGYQLDRYPDNDGNYEPGNIRFATRKQQQRHRRTTRWLEVNGSLMPLSEVYELANLPFSLTTFRKRIDHGWTVEEAINTPKGKQGKQ